MPQLLQGEPLELGEKHTFTAKQPESREFGDFTLHVEWRWPDAPVLTDHPVGIKEFPSP